MGETILKEKTKKPSCERVLNATIFFASFSTKAIIPPIKVVTRPKNKRNNKKKL